MTDTPLLEDIRLWARELGFQQIGVSDIDVAAHAEKLQQWLKNGYHADMAWMQQHAALRAHPDQLHSGTLRVISVRMDYLPEDDKNLIAKINADGGAYIARYTLGRDYHKLMRKRLALLAQKIEEKSAHKHRAFVDSAPILERAFAQKSGLGWIGKNTMLINAQAGSYFFLGEILTDLPLPLTTSQDSTYCGTCSACLDLCPTQAFAAPYQLDARRCISYLTIENRHSIPLELRKPIGNRIFGCDDCQAVCPWNKFAQRTEQEDFMPRHGLADAQLIALFAWTEAEYLEKTAGSALRRIGYEGWLRNIAVALGNAHTAPEILQALQEKMDHPSDLVREHVAWALAQHAI
ncbi:MAG: tRNA epoxyqueuosine(34) reductase QueG [Pseudomonadales bacterium]